VSRQESIGKGVRPSTILDTADLRPSVVLIEDFPTFSKVFDHAFLSLRMLKMARMTDRLNDDNCPLEIQGLGRYFLIANVLPWVTTRLLVAVEFEIL
jgi:hypothetical protein